jgi:membrane protease YdiL (CAAX protease family)
VKRFGEFLRSVLPANWTQLTFLFGVVCLFIAKDLRCWPAEAISTPSNGLLDPRELWEQAGMWWLRVFIAAQYLSLFAGSAGYFICFWPGTRPVHRILYWVCLPTLAELGLICGIFLHLVFGHSLLFETASTGVQSVGRTLSVLWDIGPGFHFALLGLILVAFFTLRLMAGRSSLPVALPESSVSSSDDPVSWHRVKSFVWLLMTLLPAILWTLPVMYGIYYVLDSHFPGFNHRSWLSKLPLVIGDTVFVVVAVWMIGRQVWKVLRDSIRLPVPESFALAMAFPVGISAAISFGQFFVDRLRFLTHPFEKLDSPQIASYFNLPSLGLLSWTFVALIEEIICRGLLQPRFIRRYGLLRGIFLVGTVWTAWHFTGDFSSRLSDDGVLLRLGLRLCECLSLSFVLGWLTLRTGSVLAAALAHGFDNVLVISPFGPRFPGLGMVRPVLWGVLAYALFRYWPVQAEAVQESGAATASAAPQL